MLPSGRTKKCDRGAEQGDPLGPIYCAVVISKILEKTRGKLEERGIVLADVWYMDDGQLFCDPGDTDPILRTIDEVSLLVGLERGRGGRAKSVCRLVGSSTAKGIVDPTWYTDYIRDSCFAYPENDLE